MHFLSIFRSKRAKAGWGLAAVLVAPTLAFGQFAEVQQLSYWDYDRELDAVVPLQLDSRVFRVEVGVDMFDPASEQLLDANGGAYINVFCRMEGELDYEWVVENEFESLPDWTWFEQGNIAYEFGSEFLPNGIPIFMCELFISLTDEPVVEELDIDPGLGQWVVIDPTNKIFTDELDSELDPLGEDFVERLPWDQMSTRIGETHRPDRVARIARAPKNIPAVSEGLNECVPGATARSLGYLSILYDFQLGNPEGCIQCLHQEYVDEMETDPKVGTKDSKALSGRRKVHGPSGRNFQVRSVDSARIANTEASFGPAIETVMDQVDHGHDVEISYLYKVKDKTYGHRAMIAKIERFRRPDGSPWYRIWTIDDNTQGDSKAANDLNCLIVNEAGSIFRSNSDGSALVKYGRIDLFSSDQYVPRLSDLNNDKTVNGGDLALLLGAFDSQPDGSEGDGDLNGDGEVRGADLAITLGNWGQTFDR